MDVDELTEGMVEVWHGGWSDWEGCRVATIWEDMKGDLWVHLVWANPHDGSGESFDQITWNDVLEIMEDYGEFQALALI